jgi:hypothetical protein
MMIQNLPQLNRNPLELLQLSGNVSGTGVAGGETDLRINGGRTSSVDYLVDGGSILSGRRHDVRESSIPRMEEVSEFKVITNGISAEYGRVSGGLVQIATRGGTNELHGQAFEYFWNELFNANSWFQNANAEYVPGQKAKRTAFHRNIFGGQVGGPVYLPKLYDGHNKTFFLFQYEGYRHSEAGVLNVTAVPSDAEREGDMTGTLFNGEGPLMWDPFSWATDSSGNLVKTALLGGDGKHVPKSYIDPVSALILEKTPHQNRTPTPGFSQMNSYAGAGGGKNTRNYWSVRLDENFTDRHRMMFRFTRNKRTDGSKQWFGDYSPGWNFKIKDAPLATLNYDWTIRPTLLFNAHASVTHEPNFNGAGWEPGDFDLTQWPIDDNMKQMVVTTRLPFRALVESSPGIGGWGGAYALNNLDAPHYNTLTYTTYNFSGAITKIYNQHTIKTGAEHRRFYDNFWESGLGWMYFGQSALTKSNTGNARRTVGAPT